LPSISQSAGSTVQGTPTGSFSGNAILGATVWIYVLILSGIKYIDSGMARRSTGRALYGMCRALTDRVQRLKIIQVKIFHGI
jgi:hypothetical protein